MIMSHSEVRHNARFPPACGSTAVDASAVDRRMASHFTKNFAAGETIFASWNVRTLLKPGAQAFLGLSLLRYNIDIACLSELRLPTSGTTKIIVPDLTNGNACKHAYTLYHSAGVRGQGGVGFAIRSELLHAVVDFQAVNERIAKLRLKSRTHYLSVIAAYAPTNNASDDDKDQFYADLTDCITNIPSREVTLLCGDFNAKLGEIDICERSSAGSYTLGNRCDNGMRLISFAMQHALSITNTQFRRGPHQLATWKSNDGKTRNQIDYIMINKRWRSSVLNTRTRWKDLALSSDHALLTMTFRLRFNCRPKMVRSVRFDTKRLEAPAIRTLFIDAVRTCINTRREEDHWSELSIDTLWEKLSSILVEEASKHLKQVPTRKSHWISAETLNLIAQRNEALKHGSRRRDLRQLESQIKAKVLNDRENYWTSIATKLENAAAVGDTKSLFRFLKCGSSFGVSEVMKSNNGAIITSQQDRVDLWREHFCSLLNRSSPPTPPTITAFEGFLDIDDSLPSIAEVRKAIKSLKAGKAAGEDGIPAEFWKIECDVLIESLHLLMQKIWLEEKIPQDWESAIILPFFKKGDKSICKNYRGISLLNIAFKILEIVILERIRPQREQYMRENQAGFRRGRGCTDQIFTLRQLLELRHEYRQPSIVCFIDFSAAFDSVDRPALLEVLASKGVSPKMCNMIRCLYHRTTSKVRVYNTLSNPFTISTGVRQGSILSPILFNFVVEWVLEQTCQNTRGGFFIHQSNATIFDLDFADDIALLAESTIVMQNMVDGLSQVAQTVGLQISTEKTKLICCCCSPPPQVALHGHPLEIVKSFKYLGSEFDGSGASDSDIKSRIAKAQYAFNQLYNILWKRRDISVQTKSRVYDATVRSVLLYGCEAWQLKESDIHALSIFEHKCWRRCLNIRYSDRIPNAEVRRRFIHERSLKSVINERRLRWLGHVLRMEDHRLPRLALFAEPERHWKRPRGGVRKTYNRALPNLIERYARPPQLIGRKWPDWRVDCLEIALNRERWRAMTRDIIRE